MRAKSLLLSFNCCDRQIFSSLPRCLQSRDYDWPWHQTSPNLSYVDRAGQVRPNVIRKRPLAENGRSCIVSWYQREIQLPAFSRGFHLITRQIVDALPELARIEVGLLNVFLQHTSASLSINENADPDVPADLERAFNVLAPEDFPYHHTIEGPDDMPGHVKASLLGCSLTIPIRKGSLALGTWQGVYLCEHRRHGGRRRLVMTVQGEEQREDRS
jgi:secondary thiamine-phosphate synthase enzyme